MAMRLCCDAYGTPIGVKTYMIDVPQLDGTVVPREVVLCPRGLKRLQRLIERGCSSASRKGDDDDRQG